MPRRRKDRIDDNQNTIVETLRERGYSVEVGHDDILVGYKGKTYWYEIKTKPRSTVQYYQNQLLDNFQGHYKIVWTAQMIINDIEAIEK